MSEYRIFVPLPNEIGAIWYLVDEQIENACKYSSDTISADTLLVELMAKRAFLFLVIKDKEIVGSSVAEIANYPLRTVLLVDTLGGKNSDEWLDILIEALEKFAESLEIDCIQAICRPGLSKILKNKNWSQKSIVMELEI